MNQAQQRWIFTMIPLLVVVTLLATARFIETTFFPIVTNFVVSTVTRTGENVILTGTLEKHRAGMCKFLATIAKGVYADGVHDEELPLRFLDNPRNQRANRPDGFNNWGPWQIVVTPDSEVQAIQLTSVHQCHPLWTQRTYNATVPLAYSMP